MNALGDASVFGPARRRRRRGAASANFARARRASWRHVPDRPADRLGDLVERHREHVVQDERDPLPRTQLSQHLQQRGADLVVEGDAVGGIAVGVDLDQSWFLPEHFVSRRTRADRS